MQYRPWRKWKPDQEFRKWSVLAHAVREEVKAHPKRGLPNFAVYQLLVGKTSGAIASLELAAADPETAVAALTDLSAVYLARFDAEGDPLDLLRSAHASERGLSLSPAQPSLLFNRAQALTWLGTRTLAKATWRELREPGWREEATSQLRKLGRPTAEEEWQHFLPEIEAPSAPVERINSLVERLPWNARLYGEEILLPRWAAAVSRGDLATSRKSLRLAATIGEALARLRGEELLADAVVSIRITMEGGSPDERECLLRGLQDFGTGVIQYNEQNLNSAKEPLIRAVRELTIANNPLRFWARFYLSIGEYYSDADRGLAILDTLLAEIPQERYPGLTGRIEWIAATIDKVQARIQSSVRRYERAASALHRSGGDVAAAFASVLLAESYSFLGEHSLGWHNRMLAFQYVPFSEGFRRNIAMWSEAKGALDRQGNLALAGPFVAEAVALAEQWGRPLGLATAYLDRSSYWLAAGARKNALADLRVAQRALSQMEDSGLKDQIAYLSLITEGLCYQTTDPVKGAALLQSGLERQTATGNRFEAITYTTAKAAAQLAAGEVKAGTESLEEALSIFEEIRATVEDPVSRMQAFRQAQPAFDSLIHLSMSNPTGDREFPFLLAERSRARVLLDLRTSTNTRTVQEEAFARLSDIEKALPAGVALASYAVLDDRVLVWVVEVGHTRLLTLQANRKDIADAITRFRREVAREADEVELQSASSPLYDSLIRPLGLVPHTKASLIIVPDRWLAQLPFAALFDRTTGKYLIEQRTITMVPSATLLMRGGRTPRRGEPQGILTVGVSRPGSFAGRTLSRLPEAEREAREVAALYEKPRVLLDGEATKENFLRLSVSKDVLHFAGHAVVDVESPRRSVLLFAGSSAEALEPLSLGELFDAGLGNARLVVLSACRAQDSLAEDREGLLGLAGAFFAAGVPEILASPWDVNDRSALPVMLAFHREYRKQGSAGMAFRKAVLELLRSGSSEERSPASWGGFTVIAGSMD
jgi:CHAT domain-containing protein